MISVILAGGKGLRLWPESRRDRPKQLCKFVGNKSMLEHTIDRLRMADSDRIIIITNDELLPSIQNLVSQRSDAELIEILSEPEGKNTAPAVGLALARLFVLNKDEIIGVFPADHHILDNQGFKESIERASLAAENGFLATLGITPNRPETGYGYIEKTKWEIGEIPDVFQVKAFYEKPDFETAQSYLSTGQHMWNAGIYIGKTKVFLDEFKKHLPELYERIIAGFDNYLNSYQYLPNISLDYGIAEKSNRMAVVPADFGWCDLGSWNALAELYREDKDKNVCSGKDIVLKEASNCVVKQSDKTVVLFGVKDLLVVETDDVIFVSDRQRSQEVRNLTDDLYQKHRLDLL
jgi:mannose-1-phosphate guanylyltransferase